MARVRDAVVRIRGQETVSDASKKARNSLGQLDKTGQTMTQKGMRNWTSLASKAGIYGAAIAGTVMGMKNLVDAYAQQEAAERKLTQAAENNPMLDQGSARRIREFAGELQEVSVVGDEVSIALGTMLATTGRTEDQIREILTVAADLSAAMDMDMRTAVVNLNKTFGGTVGELGEVIPALKDLSKEELEAGEAVDFLRERVEGQAEALRNTTQGAMQAFANNWGDLKESLGEGAATLFNPIVEGLNSMIEGFNNAAGAIRQFRDARRDAAEVEGGGASADVETRHLEREVERLAGEIEQRQTELARVQESAARALLGQGISEGTELFRRELEREIAPYEQALEQAIRQQSGAAQRLSALTAASGGGGDGARAPELTEDQKRIQQAVADISREFRLLEEQAAVPGREMDLFAEKQKVLNSAIDDLIQDNFTVGGGGIQFILERFGKYLEEAGDEVEESGKDLADKIRNVTAGDPSRSGLELTAYQGGQSLGQTGGGGLFAPSPPTTGSTAGPGFGAELMGELGGFAGIMSTAAEATEGFGGELMGLVGALGPMGVAVATVNQMLEGFMQVMGPVYTDVLEPLGNLLGQVGTQIANLILPVTEQLAPVLQLVTHILGTVVTPIFEALAPVLQFVGDLWGAVLIPQMKVFASAIEIVVSALTWLRDRVKWLGENFGVLIRNLIERVATFGHNLAEILSTPRKAIDVLVSWLEALGKNIKEVIDYVTSLGRNPIKKHSGDSFGSISPNLRNPKLEGYIDFDSDALTGLPERLKEIWGIEAPSFAPGEFDSGGGVHGGNTTVQRAPDIYATLNFHGPIIGESGMVEVGEFFVEGVQAYLGAGGEVQFLEAR
ncbi:MAG: hypothetical protein ACLFS5_01830 [Spirochaetaceae bacterium]